MKALQNKLTRLFESVEPGFRADLTKRYTDRATSSLENWLKRLEGDEPKREGWQIVDLTAMPEYVKDALQPKPSTVPGEWKYYKTVANMSWTEKQSHAKNKGFIADIDRATRDANMSVDNAKLAFVSKMTAKIRNAVKLRGEEVPKISGVLQYSRGGRVAGYLDVKYKNGDRFRVDMSVIVNCRHSMRGYTSFYQFPARFKQVHIGPDTILRSVSEDWMSKHFKVKDLIK